MTICSKNICIDCIAATTYYTFNKRAIRFIIGDTQKGIYSFANNTHSRVSHFLGFSIVSVSMSSIVKPLFIITFGMTLFVR